MRTRKNPGLFATGVLAGAVFMALLAAACGAGGPAASSSGTPSSLPPLVRVATVTQGGAPASFSYTGDVRPQAQVSIAAKMPGRLQEVKVDVGDSVKKGDLLAVLEHSALDAQVKQAEAGVALARARLAQVEGGTRAETIAQAQANLDSAREKHAAMREGGRAETVAQAEAGLRLAEAKLAQLRAGPTPEQIAQAEAAVRAAKNQLYSVQAQADSAMSRMGSGYTPDMKEANSGAAYEQIQITEARLAELKAGPTPEQLAQALAAVDQARSALELARKPFTDRDLKQAENAVAAAEQQLNLAQNPFTSHDLEAASAQLAQAQAAADAARAQAQDAILLAPMDGVVSERFLSPGAMAGPAAPILTLISVRTEVVFSVEEFRTGWVAAGQPVSIFVSAYPDQAFSGLVSVVAPSLDPRSRTFTVKVEPEDPKGKLKPGMSARIELAQEGGEKRGLWVPAEAVIKQEDGAFVFTVAAGKARKQKVEVGATEGGETVILAGLSNGDRVIVSGQASVKDGEPVRVQG